MGGAAGVTAGAPENVQTWFISCRCQLSVTVYRKSGADESPLNVEIRSIPMLEAPRNERGDCVMCLRLLEGDEILCYKHNLVTNGTFAW